MLQDQILLKNKMSIGNKKISEEKKIKEIKKGINSELQDRGFSKNTIIKLKENNINSLAELQTKTNEEIKKIFHNILQQKTIFNLLNR